MDEKVIFWFRRDLRIEDNRGLSQALRSSLPVLPVFIFDTEILEKLAFRDDSRLTFIADALSELKRKLEEIGSSLLVLHGKPEEVWADLFRKHRIVEVFTNRDSEPYARLRDKKIAEICQKNGAFFRDFNDHLVFEAGDLLKNDGTPYTVFTPYYKNRWLPALQPSVYEKANSEAETAFFLKTTPFKNLSLEEIGFKRSDKVFPAKSTDLSVLSNYDEQRDFPAVSGTSRLGVHLRFGTISIRQVVRDALSIGAESWLRQLAWRDFFSMILAHFPQTAEESFKPAYDRIVWRNNEKEFLAWTEGRTGYPMVDAGMRELVQTGFMHNRLRMLTAGFLSKHLLIDWRWGESFFASHLLDYDQASNVGGWQWAAGCGCDAAPYFRIFSPIIQQKKFDPKGIYSRKFIAELNTSDYPKPITDHSAARDRAIKVYRAALSP